MRNDSRVECTVMPGGGVKSPALTLVAPRRRVDAHGRSTSPMVDPMAPAISSRVRVLSEPHSGLAAVMDAIRARSDAEFRAKGTIEIRQIAEAAIQGDVEDPRWRGCPFGKPQRGLPQARPQNVLMRSYARHAFE